MHTFRSRFASISSAAALLMLMAAAPCSASFISDPTSFTFHTTDTHTTTLIYGREDAEEGPSFFGDANGWFFSLDLDLELQDSDTDGNVESVDADLFFFDLSHNGLQALYYTHTENARPPAGGEVMHFKGSNPLKYVYADGSYDLYTLAFKILSVTQNLQGHPGDNAYVALQYDITLTGEHVDAAPAVPEPASLTMTGFGLLGLVGVVRRKLGARRDG